MADTIDGLYIEIESGASNAGSQLDALTTKLEGLKRVVGSSTPLKTFSKNYTELMNAINSAPGIEVSKLEGLRAIGQVCSGLNEKKLSPSIARNIQTLFNTINETSGLDVAKLEGLRAFTQVMSNMNGIKISGSIAKQLNNLDFVVQNLSGENLTGLMNFINAITQLNQLQNVKISSTFVNNLQSLVELAQKIQGQSFSSLNEFTSAIANLGAVANTDSGAVKGLTSSIRSLSNSTRTASSRGRTFNTVLANIRVRTLALVRVTQMIRRATTQAIGVYGDYIETLNLFKMAMGSAGKEAYEFAEKAQALLGIDLTQWMKAQGVFNALASGFGVASDRAAIMSKNLTQLAYDISSFYNIDVDTAVEKVRSGFSGQIRPVRDLGYDLSQARLEAIALSLGIDKTVKSMTQAEKSQLRYIALMTQLKQVQGDLARTLDSPINQMRILQAQLQQMYRSIGMTLLPILNRVLPYLNAILRVIKMIADEIAAMFGYTLPKITGGDWSSSVVAGAEDIEDELDSATGAAEKLKNTLAGFDQINLISSKSGGGGSGAGVDTVSGGFDFDLPEYDFLGDATVNKAQEIADGMMKAIRPFVDYLKTFIKWVVDNIDAITKALEILVGVTILNKLVGALSSVFDLGDKVSKIFKNLEFIVVGLQFSFMGGKELASGNFATGLIESAIGAAFLAKGMSFAFGPGGIIVGLGVSFVMTLAGYLTEKDSQRVEANIQKVSDAFYKLRDNADGLDNLRDSWQKFTESFYSPEASEKSSVAKQTEETVLNIATAMGDLYSQYTNGTITASMFAANLEVMYGQMEDAVKNHLKATGDAITEYLKGPYGLWLQSHGYIIGEIEQTIEDVTTQIQKEIEKNELKLQEYNHALETGALSVDEYNKKVEELLGPMSDYYASLIANSGVTEEFTRTFNNMELNFEDYDTLIGALDDVGEAYKNASKSIDQQVADIQAHLRTYINAPGVTDAQKALFESLITEAENYGKEQKRILDENYVNILESIEDQAGINWMEALGTQGFEDVMLVMSGDMQGLDDKLEELYGLSGQTRSNEYWKALMRDINDFDREFEKSSKGRGLMVFDWDSMEDTLKEYKNVLGQSSMEYAIFVYEQKKKRGELSKDEERFLNALKYNYENATDEVRKNVKLHFDSVGNIIAVTSEDMVDDMSYAIGAIGTMIGNDAWAVSPMADTMNDLIQVVDGEKKPFVNGFWGLMNSATYVLGDPTGMMQRSLFNALDIPELKLVGLGYDLGASIAEGIEDSTPEISAAAHHWSSEIAREWNIFGTEADKYFEAIFENGMAALNLLGTGNNVTSSVFNVKKARIRGYASGGFPDTADFFYANENGVPEYVGTIGGRTAVANNTDIVKGVSDGVYRAIASTGIQNDVKKIANKNGTVVFAPSEEAGKVMQQSVGMYNGTGGRY